MNFLPIIIGLILFLKLNPNSKLKEILLADYEPIISSLTELGIDIPFLKDLPINEILSLLKGEMDFKTILPLIIKLFNNKKEQTKPLSCPIDSFVDSEIKTALYNYLNI